MTAVDAESSKTACDLTTYNIIAASDILLDFLYNYYNTAVIQVFPTKKNKYNYVTIWL